MSDLFLKQYLEKSNSYEEYRERFEKTVQEIKDGTSKLDHTDYYVLNWQRSLRNEKTFQLSTTLSEILKGLTTSITWLVITEPWCGDSAQSLAALHKIAKASNGKIDLKIFYRDSDTTLIDRFLTNGARSIPKLLQLDTQGTVTDVWGPRPKPAQELVVRLKSNPDTAATYGEELHKWYAENKMITLQEEIGELLKSASR